MVVSFPRWGIVSTIKAQPVDLLNFAAFHLEAGAHRLFLYLDAPCPEALPLLSAHPKVRVFECDDISWRQRRKKGGKPEKHQVRQTLNATRAYRRQARDVDWLIHMDVDEFLWSDHPILEVLRELDPNALCARVRPIESLADSENTFKRPIPSGLQNEGILNRLYPEFGTYLRGGFLSHVQGKLFVRTGLDDIQFRIHNVFLAEEENPSQVELADIELCHLHVGAWEQWIQHYSYRLQKGSYRSELKPARPTANGGINLHRMMSLLEAKEGRSGLRRLFDEVCADSEDLRSRLAKEGLLSHCPLNLEAKRRKHFPDFVSSVSC